MDRNDGFFSADEIDESTMSELCGFFEEHLNGDVSQIDTGIASVAFSDLSDDQLKRIENLYDELMEDGRSKG